MIQPSPEQLAVLRPIERLSYAVGDLFARRLKWLSIAWNSTFMVALLWLGSGRRLCLDGLEHLAAIPRDQSVILACNHRSFFDFFTVNAVWYRQGLSRRGFFPVRSRFFYDTLLGLALNLLLGGMAMFPPVMRSRRQLRFNLYATDRLAAELAIPGTVVGIHPEGTRNKDPDPHTLLPPQPGVGRIALAAPQALVIPIFMCGPSNNLAAEILKNLLAPRRHPIDLLFGPPVDLSSLRGIEPDASAQREAAERVMAAIRALAERRRELAAARELAEAAK